MIESNLFRIEMNGEAERLWTYRLVGKEAAVPMAAPVFEINGRRVQACIDDIQRLGMPEAKGNGTVEYRYGGTVKNYSDLFLAIVFRVSSDNAVVRYRYILQGTTENVLTKVSGKDELIYGQMSLDGAVEMTEVRFSEFSEFVHSFCLSELPIAPKDFENGRCVMGPMVTADMGGYSLLYAYEHGSQVPDAFMHYVLADDYTASLSAVKGNYVHEQSIDGDGFETAWMQVAAIEGDVSALAAQYRMFALRYFSANAESRKPYIFYNTWNLQERSKHWYKQKYLTPIYLERVLKEIDLAHQAGIDVFVIDAGWFEKTGDWVVNRTRFPDMLKSVKERLDDYGMKLGLWFEPTSAALTSDMLANQGMSRMSWKGELLPARQVWETEDSVPMCLVSEYWEAFANELIRLVKDVGVTYFKWDYISQYGCDDPNHWHGDHRHSPEERADRYAFLLGRYMSKIVDKVCAECPEAIIDFDVTEGFRYVGLGFLSSGKYFLVNNGPYYQSYDLPKDLDSGNGNIFFYPGQARGWICRTPLSLDKWLPSILFLVHYFPDDPADRQIASLASMFLGHNGIWGDLSQVSKEGLERIGEWIADYKKIREEITESPPICYGQVGGSPEIYEKIHAVSGKGIVSIFSSSPGRYTYVTDARVNRSYRASDGVDVNVDDKGRAVVQVSFEQPGAAMVLFGI